MGKEMCVFFLKLVVILSQIDFTSSRYTTSLIEVEKCKNPDPPYAKDDNVFIEIIPYNVSDKVYIKGNVTYAKDLKGYNFFFRSKNLDSGSSSYTLNWPKLTCTNVLVRLILVATKTKYDVKTCIIKKNSFSFEKLDLYALDFAFNYFPFREAGLNRWTFGLYKSSQGTSYCYDMVVLTKITE